MRLEISLNGEYTDFHALIPYIHSFTTKPSVLSVAFLGVSVLVSEKRDTDNTRNRREPQRGVAATKLNLSG
jgi:hypothetical protein